MNFFVLWLLTIVTSYGCYFKVMVKQLVDFANAGYKLNLNSNSYVDLESSVDTDVEFDISKLSFFIPFFNLYSVLEFNSEYEQNKEFILQQLVMLDIFVEMTDEEKKKYLNNPCVVNAISIAFENAEKNDSENIPFDNEFDNNNYFIVNFVVKEDNIEYAILKIKVNYIFNQSILEILTLDGPAYNLSYDQALEYFRNVLDKVKSEIDSKSYKDGDTIVISNSKPKTKLERYIDLRDSLKQNGYLYGEEMCEYRDLENELGFSLNLKK